MKKITNFAIAMLCSVIALSCVEGYDSVEEYIDVTPSSISGVWRMESYDNGHTLADGTYYYIRFNRMSGTFVSYDNLGSMEAHERSGRYHIESDGQAIIRGLYDFGQGDWEHSYYVRNMTANRMVWVAVDDESIVQVYVRSTLPEGIRQ